MKKNVEKLKVNRKFFMRLTALTAIVFLFILPVKMNAQGAKTNFSGKWAFNETKSNLGEGRGFRSASQITVIQAGNKISVERVRTNQNGEATTTTEKYTMDGKESKNTSSRGPSTTIVTWSADGKVLKFAITRTFERNGASTTMKSTEVWNLSDPKTLSIQSSFEMQEGERKTTLVYDKK